MTDNSLHLAVDIVLLTGHGPATRVLLIRRSDDSDAWAGYLALPGGYVDAGERIEDAARRELAEETGLVAPKSWRRVGIYDAPKRDYRGRVVSIAYAASIPGPVTPPAGSDTQEASWEYVHQQLSSGLTPGSALAFDHGQILTDAYVLLRGDV